MPSKKEKKELSFVDKMRRFSRAGISGSSYLNKRKTNSIDNLKTLEERVEILLNIVKSPKTNANQMLFFIMYDISSTKVRNQVAKYLLKNGCFRVQKSIFLADLPLDKYNEIRTDLSEVQQCYENEDSILIVPISTDYLRAMRIIGQQIDIELIMNTKNTLFF